MKQLNRADDFENPWGYKTEKAGALSAAWGLFIPAER